MTLALTDAGKGADEQEVMRVALRLVNVKDCLATADALHAQVETAQAILDREADYLLALKGNQRGAYEPAAVSFDLIRSGEEKAVSHCIHQNYARGPREERQCLTLTDLGLLDPFGRWPRLATIVCVQRRYYQGRGQPRSDR